MCFRDLEKATEDAKKTFGDENSVNIILEKSYEEYMEGFTYEETGKVTRGYKDICNEIVAKFPDPTEIFLEAGKKELYNFLESYWSLKIFWKISMSLRVSTKLFLID